MHASRITTKSTIAVLALGSVVALTVGPATSTGAASGTGAPSTADAIETLVLAFPFEGGHQRFIDQGRKGIDPGDLFLNTGLPILDNTTSQPLGTSDAVELIVSKRHDGTVTSQSTLRLPGGQIQLDGVVRHTDDPFRVTVTGGTGHYLGVGGQLTLVRENRHRHVTVMKLELVH